MLGKARSASSFDGNRARSDVNRLLDPSYTTSYYNEKQQSSYGAYVDAQGNLHDPDYRHFPLLQQSNQYPYNRRTSNSTRPHWELVHEEASLLENDDDLFLQEEDTYYSKRNSFGGYKSSPSTTRHCASSHRSSSPQRPISAYPRATAGYPDMSPPTSWSSTSSSSESSSPSSTCSSVLNSPFEPASEKSRCRIASSLKSRRRRSAASAPGSEKRAKRTSRDFHDDDDDFLYRQEWPVAEEEEEEERLTEEQEKDERRPEDSSDSVPTCTDALKRRWQNLALSIQFGMFRAERRIKRRVRSLI